MAVETRAFEYADGPAVFRGELARDTATEGKRPGVLVVHTWAGCGPFERGKAADIANLGYAALAVDLYGNGTVGSGPAENARLMAPLLEDRSLLQRRMQRSLDALRGEASVDPTRTAAVGFCFGGLCVLDLARTGAEICGVVSFHGLLDPPGNTKSRMIRAKILALHGWDDPMAQPASVAALARELTAAQADWQLHVYGQTMHAFTNPAASSPARGTVYDPQADRRSWQAMRNFLAEVLA